MSGSGYPMGGGKQNWPLFWIKDTGSAYSIVAADGTTAAAAVSDAMIILNKMEVGNLEPQDTGALKVSLDQHQYGKKYTAVLKKFAKPPKGGGTQKEIKLFDNSTIGGTTSGNGNLLLCLAYGPTDEDDDDDRLVVPMILGLAPTSGKITMKADDTLKPSFEATSQKLKYNLTINKNLFDSSLVTLVADVTINAVDEDGNDVYYDYLWLPSHA